MLRSLYSEVCNILELSVSDSRLPIVNSRRTLEQLLSDMPNSAKLLGWGDYEQGLDTSYHDNAERQTTREQSGHIHPVPIHTGLASVPRTGRSPVPIEQLVTPVPDQDHPLH